MSTRTEPETAGAIRSRKNILSTWRDNVIYFIFIGIFILFASLLFNRGFLSPTNLLNIVRQTAMICILSVGMTMVLAAEEIDLSFGAIVALAALITAMTLRACCSAWRRGRWSVRSTGSLSHASAYRRSW